MKYTLLVAILLLGNFSCIRVRSVKDDYKMFIQPELNGIIDRKHLNRGGTMQIILSLNQEDNSIWMDGNYFAYDLMKNGDSVVKFSNSDKVLLVRGDSMIKFTNYIGDSKEIREYRNYESWEKNELNIWIKKE